MRNSTEEKIATDSGDSAVSAKTQPTPKEEKPGKTPPGEEYKREQVTSSRKVTSQEKNNSILQKLMTYSQKVSYQIKLPLDECAESIEQSYLQDVVRSNPDLFQRPMPIRGIRTAVEVEHRGLGEEKRQDNIVALRRKRHLFEQSEQNRRERRNYYEQLLKDLSKSNGALGKRSSEGTGFNAFGVPGLSVSPEELRDKAKTFELGNYPTSVEVARTRLRALNDGSLFDGCRVLDFGCGDGSLLFEIAKAYKPCYIKGVDADSKLIESAAAMAREATSTEQSKGNQQQSFHDLSWVPLCFQNRCRASLTMSERSSNVIGSGSAERASPLFEAENIIADITKYRLQQFDTVICLSLTKWIHLNWGDPGLIRLLLKIYNSLKIGGRLILDIHDWKSYKKKKNFSTTFQYTFSTISIKPRFILERFYRLGFEKEREIDYGYETDLKRPIFILKKTQ